MNSIYHFFKNLCDNRESFVKIKKLGNFPFDKKMLSCRNDGVFPDMAIRLNSDKSLFTGGELIELKDSDSYTVSSFNSTIPTGKKEIAKIVTSENSIIKQQMENAGNNILSLPTRDVFYLIRGKHNGKIKVCLVHGSFFETLKIDELIQQSFGQVLEERLKEIDEQISDEWKKKLLSIFSQQENFSRVRNVDKASVKLRFRIMTEVKVEGNILNSKKYPEIGDNTLNFLLPLHDNADEMEYMKKLKIVFDRDFQTIKNFKIKHLLNGYFKVFQTDI
ncbi:MAG: hypothetical protein V1833_01330 [Elusimicrobiota bacterium]